MELIDVADPQHALTLAKIKELSQWPHHCFPQGSAMRSLVALRLTVADVMEAVRQHLGDGHPVYYLIQEQTQLPAYVFLPCIVCGDALYVKIQFPPAASELQERLILISAHPPKYPPPRRR